MYADIIIDITHEKLDKVFQYRVPEELEGDLRTGAGVIVPFGRGNRETKGYIVGYPVQTCLLYTSSCTDGRKNQFSDGRWRT